jgi:hypothetical protein
VQQPGTGFESNPTAASGWQPLEEAGGQPDELTPEREYLLVTELFDGATELGRPRSTTM